MRHQGFSLWKMAASLCGIGVVAMVIYPVFQRAKENEHPASCMSNLKQISLGIRQYVQDYDYALPAVSQDGQGWADVIQPYLKSRRIFHCPTAQTNEEEITSDYFFNSRLTPITLEKIGKRKIEDTPDFFPEPALTIMLGDGMPGAGTDSSQASLGPTDRFDSPARRHLEGANYAFIDGHIKFLKPDSISDESPNHKSQRPTFAAK